MTTDPIFEEIKYLNEIGQEYWSARELYKALDYLKWDKFLNVIEKAQTACKTSGFDPLDHFPQVEKMIKLPKGATRNIGDIHLTRYACYLIVQNKEIYLFLGTTKEWHARRAPNPFVIIGVFYPKIERQMRLL